LGGVLIWSAAARYSATPLWLVIESIGKESGVAEYLAAALQIKTAYPSYLKNCAFFSINACHFAGTSASIKMADTGQAGSQAAQSVQVAGSMYICC
jgi:hypothetical protein